MGLPTPAALRIYMFLVIAPGAELQSCSNHEDCDRGKCESGSCSWCDGEGGLVRAYREDSDPTCRSNFCAPTDHNHNGGCSAHQVVEAMTAGLGNSSVQWRGCYALAVIADDSNWDPIPAKQNEIREAGGIGSVTTAMVRFRNDPDVQRFACWALLNIAEDNPINQDAIRWADGVRHLTSAMKLHPENHWVQKSAIQALQCLAEHDPVNRDAIAEAGGISLVTAALSRFRDPQYRDLQRRGCDALGALAEDNRRNQNVTREVGGIESVVTAMVRFPDDADMQCSGCNTLRILTVDSPTNQMAVVLAGGIGAVAAAMNGPLDDYDWTGCGLINECQAVLDAIPAANPCTSDDCGSHGSCSSGWCTCDDQGWSGDRCDTHNYCDGSGGVTPTFHRYRDPTCRSKCYGCSASQIVAAMEGAPRASLVQSNGCEALWNLAKDNTTNRDKIRKVGGIELVVAAMARFPDHAGVQMQACDALRWLANESPTNRKVIKANVRYVKAAMDRFLANDDVQNNCQYALDGVCAGVDCGGHGICAYGDCTCETGYFGERCQRKGGPPQRSASPAEDCLGGKTLDAGARGIRACEDKPLTVSDWLLYTAGFLIAVMILVASIFRQHVADTGCLRWRKDSTWQRVEEPTLDNSSEVECMPRLVHPARGVRGAVTASDRTTGVAHAPFRLSDGKKFHFFICHHQGSGGDQSMNLFTRLQNLGCKVWYDNGQNAENRNLMGMQEGVRLSMCLLIFLSGRKETAAKPDINGLYEGTFTRWFCHEEMHAAHLHGLRCVGVMETDERHGKPDFVLEKHRALTGNDGRPVHEKYAKNNLRLLDEVCFIPLRRQEHEVTPMLQEIIRMAQVAPRLQLPGPETATTGGSLPSHRSG